MNVTCPQCGTVYRLPEDAKPGARLRCSVCRHVFPFPEEAGTGTLSLNVDSAPDIAQPRVPAGLDLSSVPMDGEPYGGDNLNLDGGRTAHSSDSSGNLSLGLASAGLDLAVDDGEPARETPQDSQLAEDASPKSSSGEQLEMPSSRGHRCPGLFTMLLCAVILVGGWWMWENTPYLDGLKQLVFQHVPGELLKEEPASPVANLELRDQRQYVVENRNLGKLVVIEGKVHNGASSARAFIRVEGSLRDADGKVLLSRQQLAGTSIGSFQLEVLDREELENALNSRLDIVSANTDVQPGGEVPFIMVFSDVPEGATDYNVKVVAAEPAERTGNLTE